MALTMRHFRRGGWAMTGGSLRAKGRFGTAPLGRVTLTDATVLYELAFSLATTAGVNIDLKGGGGELDALGAALALDRVRWVYCEVTSPGATKYLHLGPLNQTNAWQGWWGGVGATDFTLIADQLEQFDSSSVWPAVDGTHKVVRLYNPSAVTVAGRLWVAGL